MTPIRAALAALLLGTGLLLAPWAAPPAAATSHVTSCKAVGGGFTPTSAGDRCNPVAGSPAGLPDCGTRGVNHDSGDRVSCRGCVSATQRVVDGACVERELGDGARPGQTQWSDAGCAHGQIYVSQSGCVCPNAGVRVGVCNIRPWIPPTATPPQ